MIVYRHRGAPGDERAVTGAQVVAIGHGFLELASEGPRPAMIPYHRILRIELDGAVVWRRPGSEAAQG